MNSDSFINFYIFLRFWFNLNGMTKIALKINEQ